MLAYVFASYGNVYLIDNHDMTQTYVFNFPVTWDLAFICSTITTFCPDRQGSLRALSGRRCWSASASTF